MPKIKSLDFIVQTLDISKDELRQLDFAPGQIIAERYEVVELLGAGGMGAVYLVKDTVLDNDLKALKIMLPNLLDNEDARKRFHKEILISQKLNHPNILRVFDYMTSGEIEFFTMEYVDGINMREWLDAEHHQGHVALPKVAPLMVEILMGLACAHRITVHRDIKPENILLPKPPSQIKVKICDFGLAQLQKQGRAIHTSHIMGTFNYMAPEQQLPGAGIDTRSDLYAVGVIFYEALTQEKPAGLFELPCSLRQDLPSQVDDFIKRALKRKPDDRFQDALEMIQALRQLAPDIALPVEGMPETPSSATLEVSSLEREFAANLERVKHSGAIRAYVWKCQGKWSEEDWELWTRELQLKGFYPLDEQALAEEAAREQEALDETRREVATKKRMIVALEKGFRYQDGLELIGELAKIGLEDEELEGLATRLRQKQSEWSENRAAGMQLWQGRDVAAIDYLERALELNPIDEELKNALADARAEKAERERRYAEVLQQGDDLVSSGQWTQALATWENALGLVSDDSTARARIEEIQDKQQRYLALLQEARDETDPFRRMPLLKQVLAINPAARNIQAMLAEVEQEIAARRQKYEDAVQQVQSLQQQGDFAAAIEVLRRARGLVPDEQTLRRSLKAAEAGQKQLSSLIAAAQDAEDPFSALTHLEAAHKLSPGDESILRSLEEVRQQTEERRLQYTMAQKQRIERKIADKQYAEWMRKGRKAEAGHDFSTAGSCYHSALQCKPADAEAQQAVDALPGKMKAAATQRKRSKAGRKKALMLVGACLLLGCVAALWLIRTSSDERFQVSADNVIKDTTTGLEWYVGPDKDITHYEAEKWVAALTVSGGGWRMPTIEELRKLYQRGKGKCNIDPLFNDTSTWLWVWSGELTDKNGNPSQNRNSPRARSFGFDGGYDRYLARDFSRYGRVFAVRR